MTAALLLSCALAAPDHHLQEENTGAKADGGIVARVTAAVGEKGADKPFLLIVTMTAKEGKAKELIAAYRGAAAASKAEPGCTAYNLHRDQENPRELLLYERWKSVDALNMHLDQPYTRAFVAKIGELTDKSAVAIMKGIPANAPAAK